MKSNKQLIMVFLYGIILILSWGNNIVIKNKTNIIIAEYIVK